MRSIVICTYSQVPELYRFSSKLINLPYPKLCLKNWNRFYTTDLLKIEADWVIHVDEDAFMFDSSVIDPLLNYMEENGYVCAGMPDGGVLDIRNHNPIACNAYFLVLHRKAIIPYLRDLEEIKKSRWSNKYRDLIPAIAMNKGCRYEYCECEPFYGLYFWLASKKLSTLYLDADEWVGEPYERTSCLLKDHKGKPFLLHTWYSREYRRNGLPIKFVVSQLIKSIIYKIPIINRGLHYQRIRKAMNYVLNIKR